MRNNVKEYRATWRRTAAKSIAKYLMFIQTRVHHHHPGKSSKIPHKGIQNCATTDKKGYPEVLNIPLATDILHPTSYKAVFLHCWK